jgi:hypothetical protein
MYCLQVKIALMKCVRMASPIDMRGCLDVGPTQLPLMLWVARGAAGLWIVAALLLVDARRVSTSWGAGDRFLGAT